MQLMQAGETTAAKKRMYFFCVDVSDGLTPETGEANGQPQISTNGGAFTNTGIGVLVTLGTGWYYAELTDAAVATAGVVIEGRYKSANTAEALARSPVQVVAFDPDAVADLGLTNLDATVSGVPAAVIAIDNASNEAAAATGTTVGEMLAAIRAAVAGKLVISGTTVTLYEVDGVTAIWTATLDSATTPTSRAAPA